MLFSRTYWVRKAGLAETGTGINHHMPSPQVEERELAKFDAKSTSSGNAEYPNPKIKWKACAVPGGGGYSFVACLSHLTIDHASLSRRSTVPTPIRDLHHLGAHDVFFPYVTLETFWFILSPSCFAACAHHRSYCRSPRIRATVCSMLSSVPNFSMPHPSIFSTGGGGKETIPAGQGNGTPCGSFFSTEYFFVFTPPFGLAISTVMGLFDMLHVKKIFFQHPSFEGGRELACSPSGLYARKRKA